jgi:hypothetical protein
MSVQNTYKNRDTVNVVDFKDIPDGMIMYCGYIESVHVFWTKAGWERYFTGDSSVKSFRDYAYKNHGDAEYPWYTATESVKTVTLDEIIEWSIDDTYEDWDDDVFYDLKDDDVAKAGIARINEVFAQHPTYFEDKRVRF